MEGVWLRTAAVIPGSLVAGRLRSGGGRRAEGSHHVLPRLPAKPTLLLRPLLAPHSRISNQPHVHSHPTSTKLRHASQPCCQTQRRPLPSRQRRRRRVLSEPPSSLSTTAPLQQRSSTLQSTFQAHPTPRLTKHYVSISPRSLSFKFRSSARAKTGRVASTETFYPPYWICQHSSILMTRIV